MAPIVITFPKGDLEPHERAQVLLAVEDAVQRLGFGYNAFYDPSVAGTKVEVHRTGYGLRS